MSDVRRRGRCPQRPNSCVRRPSGGESNSHVRCSTSHAAGWSTSRYSEETAARTRVSAGCRTIAGHVSGACPLQSGTRTCVASLTARSRSPARSGLCRRARGLHQQSCAEDFGDIGDGKADSFGIVEQAADDRRRSDRTVTFAAEAAFRIAITQPDTDAAARPLLALALTHPDGTRTTADAAAEPALVVDPRRAAAARATSARRSRTPATTTANASCSTSARSATSATLPNPNAAVFPDVTWQPPALATWPATYVIFNNPGCGRDVHAGRRHRARAAQRDDQDAGRRDPRGQGRRHRARLELQHLELGERRSRSSTRSCGRCRSATRRCAS